jgi:hypothetical protein
MKTEALTRKLVAKYTTAANMDTQIRTGIPMGKLAFSDQPELFKTERLPLDSQKRYFSPSSYITNPLSFKIMTRTKDDQDECSEGG